MTTETNRDPEILCKCGRTLLIHHIPDSPDVEIECEACRYCAPARLSVTPVGTTLTRRYDEAACDHCGASPVLGVLCADCEELICEGCGRVECCCEDDASKP